MIRNEVRASVTLSQRRPRTTQVAKPGLRDAINEAVVSASSRCRAIARQYFVDACLILLALVTIASPIYSLRSRPHQRADEVNGSAADDITVLDENELFPSQARIRNEASKYGSAYQESLRELFHRIAAELPTVQRVATDSRGAVAYFRGPDDTVRGPYRVGDEFGSVSLYAIDTDSVVFMTPRGLKTVGVRTQRMQARADAVRRRDPGLPAQTPPAFQGRLAPGTRAAERPRPPGQSLSE